MADDQEVSPVAESMVLEKPSERPLVKAKSQPSSIELADSTVPPSWEGALDHVRQSAWQRLWLEVQRRPWTVLAVVPASPHRSTLRAACALGAVGWYHLARRVDVVDASTLDLMHLEDGLEDLARRRESRNKTIIAVDSVVASPTSLAITRACDLALMCVRIGDSIADAERTIEDIGVDRFVGCFLLRQPEVE